MARSERPSLILMDLDLPVVDGWEATRLLKASPETSHIPVIAVSAYAMAEDRRRALDAGCDDFISKPVDMKALGGFQREVQHHEAHEIDRLSRIALENLTGSEVLALDRIASPAKKLKALNSAGVALRVGTQGPSQGRPDLRGCLLGWTLPTDSGIHAIRLKFGTPIFPLDTVDGSRHRYRDVPYCGCCCGAA